MFESLFWEELRQAELTRSLGQVTCKGDHDLLQVEHELGLTVNPCSDCGAAL